MQPPASFQRWFATVRAVVLFLLGVGMIIYAAIAPTHDVPIIVAGLILVGIVPVDQWVISRINGRQEHDGVRAPH